MNLLKELELINFMSHKHSKLRFGKGINVLIGRKGSGKTAVLEAIRLIFGGFGRDRASKIREFIKYGEKKAIVRARFQNGFYIGGKSWVRLVESLPNSAEIIVERVIYSDGKSIFKLNGKITTRQDLIRRFSRININASNNLFFIPQEKVNDWVRLGPRERLDLLLSSIGLKELKTKLENLGEEIREKKRRREQYISTLNELEKTIKEREKNLLPPRLARDKLVRYYIFKIAHLASRKASLESELSKANERLKSIDLELEEIGKKIKAIESKRDEISKRIEKLRDDLERLILKEKVGYEYEIKQAEEKIKNYQVKLNEIRQKYEKELGVLEEIKNTWGTSDIDELKGLIQSKNERVEEINRMIGSDRDIILIRQLEEKLEGLIEEKNRLLSELQESRDEIKKILNLLDPRGKLEDLFITLHDKRISNVYGPLLFEIRIRMSMNQLREYGAIIEHALGHRLLSSFIALDRRAYNELTRIIHESGLYGSYDIYTFSKREGINFTQSDSMKVIRSIIDVARRRRKELRETAKKVLGQESGLIIFWLCDVIEGSEPAVALIESKNWNVPILVDKHVAALVLNKLDINRAVTITGEIIERKIDPLTKNVIYVTKTFPADNPENIFTKIIGFNLRAFIEFEENILSRVGELNNKISRLKQDIKYMRDNLPERIKSLDAEKRRLEEEIIDLKRIIKRVEAIRKRLSELPKDRKKVLQAVESLQRRIDEFTDKVQEIDKKADEIRAEITSLENEKDKIMETYSEYVGRIKSLEMEKEELPARIKGIKRELESVKSEIQKIRKEIIAFYEILKRSGEIDEDANIDDLIKDNVIQPAENLLESVSIDEITEELAYLESQAESLRELIFKMETKMTEIEDILARIHDHKKKIHEIDEEIEKIRELYARELEDMVKHLYERVSEINKKYKRILKSLGANGSIEIRGDKIDELELRITIDLHRDHPVEIDKGGFSSGEKTTAIMALIMSIMLTNPAPIYMFDEFDVFLDDRSLLDVMNLIKIHMGNLQGLITTTHRDEILLYADRIYYLQYNEDEKCTDIMFISEDALRGKSKSG